MPVVLRQQSKRRNSLNTLDSLINSETQFILCEVNFEYSLTTLLPLDITASHALVLEIPYVCHAHFVIVNECSHIWVFRYSVCVEFSNAP